MLDPKVGLIWPNCPLQWSYMHPHHEGVFLSFLALQQLVFLFFWTSAFLTGVQHYLTVVLISIFLMKEDVEHSFVYSLTTCTSSLSNCLLKSLSIFTQVVFILLTS